MPAPLHKIPLHKQDARAIGGLAVSHLAYAESLKHASLFNNHRDDYYVLVIVIKGNGLLYCDMESIRIQPKSIFLIKPYQVHSAESVSKDANAYFISIAPFLMPDGCAAIFHNLAAHQQCLKIPASQTSAIFKTADLLQKAFAEDNAHKTFITNSLFNALIHRVAALFSDAGKKDSSSKNQSYLIAQKFRQLVASHSFLQAPAFFAGKLTITTAHLNDCVKSTTGFSVTHFLQQAMLLEAKRNLYYTNNDVKKIAYTLGFEDPAYFSRLFKKLTHETPLAFRKKFRE